jgi:hypothetical protein
MTAVLACSVDGVHSCATPADEQCLLCVIAVSTVWLVRTSLFASLQMCGELPAAFSAELGQQYSGLVEDFCSILHCHYVLAGSPLADASTKAPSMGWPLQLSLHCAQVCDCQAQLQKQVGSAQQHEQFAPWGYSRGCCCS